MSTLTLQVEDDLLNLLNEFNCPVEQSARELMVLELYRRGAISSGKAAELLSMARQEFIAYSSRLGIPFFNLNDADWQAERDASRQL